MNNFIDEWFEAATVAFLFSVAMLLEQWSVGRARSAITSLMEELEAVDWYNQRVDACKDNELKAILAHNRDEEKEHAAMVLEWIRRQDPSFDKELKDYLFTDKAIAHE